MNQYLYEMEPKLARDSDPETSKIAAEKIGRKLGSMQRRFLDVLRAASRPMTAQEVAANAFPFDDINRVQETARNRESIRKRAGELVDAELIRIVDSAMCRVTGETASRYEVVR